MDGFFNKVLFIELGSQSFYEKEVPDRVYESFLGGKGLGLWLLAEHNPAGVDPLSPGNHLVFAVGPATDARVHGSARYGVFTRSPQTGFLSESYSGGTVADKISRTGFDAVVFVGASKEPVVVEVTDEQVLFHDASGLWGKESYESEDAVKQMMGVSQAEVVVIGPGGENMVSFATINNNYWRCAGRTGVGAVLGSKKVKAVAFHGSKKRNSARPELLESHWKDLKDRARTDKGVENYKKFGTVNMVAVSNEAGVFPTGYWKGGRRDDYYDKLSGEAHHKLCKVRPHACPRCFMACGKRSRVREGRHQGLEIEGPEFETIYAFAGLCMIDDIPEVMYLNDLCDRYGIDTITAGNLASFAMHASKLGIIPEKIEFGDADAVAGLVR
ncbi:MAG: aldehyde ferredoxin oxidoreductase N-terminal domain-containing protein, partial [bacterium]